MFIKKCKTPQKERRQRGSLENPESAASDSYLIIAEAVKKKKQTTKWFSHLIVENNLLSVYYTIVHCLEKSIFLFSQNIAKQLIYCA